MPDSLMIHIQPHLGETEGPGGAVVRTLSADDTLNIARKLGISARVIEIACLQNEIVPTRYLRNRQTLQCSDQIRLLQSRIAVIGLGGLGGLVVETLARVGIGHLTLMDGDVFEEHNLNRQLLSTHRHIGKSKAATAAIRVNEINAAVELSIHNAFLTAENAVKVIDGCDAVVDCLDNISTRFELEKAARQLGIPMVSAAIGGIAGHVTTIFPEDPGLSLVYGLQDVPRKDKGVEITLGCLPQAVFLISAVESAEVIKIALGQTQSLLRNRLWMMDLASNTYEVLELM